MVQEIFDQLRTYINRTEMLQLSRNSFRMKMVYAFIYPFNTGIVIYAGLMTFSMVVTNITGLLPQIAQDLYEGDFQTASVVFGWLFAFFLGGFFAGWCVEREKLKKWRFLHLFPLMVVAIIYTVAASSALHATPVHPAIFPAMLLFSIGIQNAMVSLTTSSLIKASQMTGVVVELGVDVAEIFHSKGDQKRMIQREALLRVIVMTSFIMGAMVSVALFPVYQLGVFYCPAAIIGLVIIHDAVQTIKRPIMS